MKTSTKKKIALATFMAVQPWIVVLLVYGEFTYPSHGLGMTYFASILAGAFGLTAPFWD